MLGQLIGNLPGFVYRSMEQGQWRLVYLSEGCREITGYGPENFTGGQHWLAEHGTEVVDLADPTCIELLGTFIAEHPDLWNEDIGL